VLAERGKLSPAELVRLRVRYFSDGAILGSKAFVEGIFESQWEHQPEEEKRRSTHPRVRRAVLCPARPAAKATWLKRGPFRRGK